MSGRLPPALLLLSHGEMAIAIRSSAAEILGDLGDVFALGLRRDAPLPSFQEEIRGVLEENGGDTRDWLILVDLFGGSCSNLSVRTRGGKEHPILSGLNLAMVIEFVLHRGQLAFPELVEKVLASGRASILDVRKKMGGRGRSSDAAT